MGEEKDSKDESGKLRMVNDKLAAENARLAAENELLRQKVDLLIRKVFGASSEKIDLDQLLLFDAQEPKKPVGDGPAPEVEPSPAKKRAKRNSREATLPADLPVEEWSGATWTGANATCPVGV